MNTIKVTINEFEDFISKGEVERIRSVRKASFAPTKLIVEVVTQGKSTRITVECSTPNECERLRQELIEKKL